MHNTLYQTNKKNSKTQPFIKFTNSVPLNKHNQHIHQSISHQQLSSIQQQFNQSSMKVTNNFQKKQPDSKEKSSQAPLRKTMSKYVGNFDKVQANVEVSPPKKDLIRLYQQNIELKKKIQSLQKKITQFKNLLQNGKNKQKNFEAIDVVMLKHQNMKLNQALKKNKQNDKNRYHNHRLKSAVHKPQINIIKDFHNQKEQDLLNIIQSFKKKVQQLNNQIKKLQRQNYVLKQQNKAQLNNRQENLVQIQDKFRKESKSNAKNVQLKNQVELLKQKNNFLQTQISQLNMKISQKNSLQDQIRNLRTQNRNLEDQLRKLSESPLFRQFKDKVQQQAKIKHLQERTRNAEEKYRRQKDNSIKLQTNLKLTQGKLIESEHQNQILSKQLQDSKKKLSVGTDPLIQKVQKCSNQLRLKIIGFIQKQQFSDRETLVSSHRVQPNNSQLEKLKRINAQLALEVDKLQRQKQIIKQLHQNLQKAMNLQKKQFNQQVQLLNKKINQLQSKVGYKSKTQIVKDGIRYQDSVSLFSSISDLSSLAPNHNYFEVCLQNLTFVDNLIKQQTKLSNSQSLISFATVDFYNHDTKNTKMGTGLSYNLNSQFSFRVQQDSSFFTYLEKQPLKIQFWASEGSNTINLGSSSIGLKGLIIKSKPNVAPVINSSVPIYLSNKAMGSVNYVMRMVKPIHQQIKNYKQNLSQSKQQKLKQSIDEIIMEGEKRTLLFHVVSAKGIKANSNSFVYYSIQLKDYFTNTSPGQNPVWNHWNILDINFNNDFKNYVRKQQVEIIVMDDNAPLNDNQEEIIGIGKISLIPLLQDSTINISVPIKKNNRTAGQVLIKVLWRDLMKDTSKSRGNEIQQQTYRSRKSNMQNNLRQQKSYQKQKDIKPIVTKKDLLNDLKKYFDKQRLDPQQAYMKFDKNNSGSISKLQFQVGLLEIFRQKLSSQQLDFYYESFQQPLNIINFTKVLYPKHKIQDIRIKQELRKINNQVLKNTQQIVENKKISLRKYLENNNILDVALEINPDLTGYVTVDELTDFFMNNDIQYNEKIQNEENYVQIIEFLQKQLKKQKQSSKFMRKQSTYNARKSKY